MESSLNEAHHEERKAETLLNAHRFQDAIQCHQKTVELLNEAMKLTAVERALESIRFQRDHHVHQQSVVRHKQSLYEARRALQHQRVLHKMASTAAASAKHAKSKRSMSVNKCDQDSRLQLAIYRNIDDNDSLLQFLRMANQAAAVDAPTDGDCDDSRASRGLAPLVKDDKTVIEELRVNNGELRRLVDVLVADLDESRAEVLRLGRLVHDMRLRLQELDDEAAANRLPTLVTAYSSSNSPFVFSSSSSSSAEIAETPPSSGDGIRTHTDLPPLEMPPLMDFSRPADQQPAPEVTGDVLAEATDSPSNTSSSP